MSERHLANEMMILLPPKRGLRGTEEIRTSQTCRVPAEMGTKATGTGKVGTKLTGQAVNMWSC